MATIKIKNLNRVAIEIKKKIKKASRDKKMLKGVGSSLVEGIRKTNFGSPSAGYLEWRRRNEGKNKTHADYVRSKINITFTGELLDDLAKNVKVDTTGGKVEYIIQHSEKLHKAYKTSEKKKGSRSKYTDISDGVSKHYKYLTFSKKTKDNLLKFIKNNLFKLIK